MTELLATRPGRANAAPSGAILIIGAFLGGGALCGVAARAWMRFISDDPEFTWSGTLFIVGLFTIVGTAQGIALAVRRLWWPRWVQTIVRVVAGFAALLLGFGAGIVMLPALVTGSLAVARNDWRRAVRTALGVVAAVNAAAMLPLLHADLTWMRAVVGWLAMIPLYGVIIRAISRNLRPLDDRWRMSRRARTIVVVAVALASTFLVLTALGL